MAKSVKTTRAKAAPTRKPRAPARISPAISLARNSANHRRLALLAAMQARQVLPFFEQEHPADARPRRALDAIHAWARDRRDLGMAEVRRLSLDAHAAARAARTPAARFAARAAGQAVATWHVPAHAMGAPMYACKAIVAGGGLPGQKPSPGPGRDVPNRLPPGLEGHSFVDLSIPVSLSAHARAVRNEPLAALGHLGTHFDAMHKEFPLRNLERPGLAFDVSGVSGRDIDRPDLDLRLVQAGMFVALFSGFIEHVAYGSPAYFADHPQLSPRLIDDLLDRQVAIIGIDFAGVRRGLEHTPMDRRCADRGVFIVENLCNRQTLLAGRSRRQFTAHTYPVRFTGMTGLPCRVVAEI